MEIEWNSIVYCECYKSTTNFNWNCKNYNLANAAYFVREQRFHSNFLSNNVLDKNVLGNDAFEKEQNTWRQIL
jgi:hypothetical protein